MDLMSLFRPKKATTTAVTARDRLVMAVSLQRAQDGRNSNASSCINLPQLHADLLAVIRRHVQVPDSAVQVNMQQEDGFDVLAMNITMPEVKAA